jgi:hypothetical protein
VLDHVERRRFLEQPAREDPAPALARLLDVDLDERAGHFLFLPRSGGFARPQPHDDVLPSNRLTRMKRHVLDDAVALVEDGEDRDPLHHWSDSGRIGTERHRRIADHRLGRILLLAFAAPGGKGDCKQDRCGGLEHVYSGIHGS